MKGNIKMNSVEDNEILELKELLRGKEFDALNYVAVRVANGLHVPFVKFQDKVSLKSRKVIRVDNICLGRRVGEIAETLNEYASLNITVIGYYVKNGELKMDYSYCNTLYSIDE